MYIPPSPVKPQPLTCLRGALKGRICAKRNHSTYQSSNYDMSIFRSFAKKEGMRLEFRGEVYNIANSANFANPTVTNINAGDFGQSTALLRGLGPPSIQLALRLVL